MLLDKKGTLSCLFVFSSLPSGNNKILSFIFSNSGKMMYAVFI